MKITEIERWQIYFQSCSQFYRLKFLMLKVSFVTSPRAPSGEKRSGEGRQFIWAYYPKVVKTNEIVRSVIIT